MLVDRLLVCSSLGFLFRYYLGVGISSLGITSLASPQDSGRFYYILISSCTLSRLFSQKFGTLSIPGYFQLQALFTEMIISSCSKYFAFLSWLIFIIFSPSYSTLQFHYAVIRPPKLYSKSLRFL